jgi:endonuclease YncB( thermonuclease family)
MQIVSTYILAVMAISQLHVSLQRSEPVLVTAVSDARTLQVQSIGRIRLLGVEPPRGSVQAKRRLSDLVLHRWVRLEYEGKPRQSSSSSRSAYVWTEDGRFVNGVLIREGLARVAIGKDSPRMSELRDAEADARVHGRGIWSGRTQARECDFAVKLRSASASVSNVWRMRRRPLIVRTRRLRADGRRSFKSPPLRLRLTYFAAITPTPKLSM